MTEQLTPVDANGVDIRIGRTIKGIATGRGIEMSTVYAALGIKRSAWYEKIKGQSHFTAPEIERAARLLKVDIRDLFTGMNGLFDGPPTTPSGGITNREETFLAGLRRLPRRSHLVPLTSQETPADIAA